MPSHAFVFHHPPTSVQRYKCTKTKKEKQTVRLPQSTCTSPLTITKIVHMKHISTLDIYRTCVEMCLRSLSPNDTLVWLFVYCRRIKKGENREEGKKCHVKTMMSRKTTEEFK